MVFVVNNNKDKAKKLNKTILKMCHSFKEGKSFIAPPRRLEAYPRRIVTILKGCGLLWVRVEWSLPASELRYQSIGRRLLECQLHDISKYLRVSEADMQ